MKNLLWIVLALIVACLVFGLFGSAISANTSSTTQAIAQIEAMRTTNHLVGQAQTTNVLLIGVIVVLLVALLAAVFVMARLLVANFKLRVQPVKVEKPKGGWISGPNVYWGRKEPRPQLTGKDAYRLSVIELVANGETSPEEAYRMLNPPPAEEETVDVREILSGGRPPRPGGGRKAKW